MTDEQREIWDRKVSENSGIIRPDVVQAVDDELKLLREVREVIEWACEHGTYWRYGMSSLDSADWKIDLRRQTNI